MADQNTASDEFNRIADEDDMRDCDEECERIREQNAGYLELFQRALKQQGLADKAINRHVGNVDFFLNEYLLYDDANEMESGCSDVGGFLGDYFIRKCTWSSPIAIEENAASIKRFYQCMRDNDLISEASYEELVQTIEEDMGEWQAACTAFDAQDNRWAFDDLDDFDEAMPDSAAPADLTTREDIIQLLTLALMYLNSKKDADAKGETQESTKWDAIESLRADGLIGGADGTASLTLTSAGIVQAETFLYVLGLSHLVK